MQNEDFNPSLEDINAMAILLKKQQKLMERGLRNSRRGVNRKKQRGKGKKNAQENQANQKNQKGNTERGNKMAEQM
jgi:UPF0716 family protein affecting phage T7 exclusion